MKNYSNFSKNFYDNLKLLGYENGENSNLKIDDLDKFSNIFVNLNSAICNQYKNEKILSKGEKLILKNFDSEYEEMSEFCEYNSSILELNQQLLENELEELEKELKFLDQESEKEKILYENEKLEYEDISSKNFILEKQIKNSNIIIQKELKSLDEQNMDKLKHKLSKLCENSSKIISEYDMNLKCFKNKNNVIIDFKKFANEEFNMITENFDNLIDNLISQYEEISSNYSNNILESKEFKTKDFLELIYKFENLSQV
jgi:hypothetical protein